MNHSPAANLWTFVQEQTRDLKLSAVELNVQECSKNNNKNNKGKLAILQIFRTEERKRLQLHQKGRGRLIES